MVINSKRAANGATLTKEQIEGLTVIREGLAGKNGVLEFAEDMTELERRAVTLGTQADVNHVKAWLNNMGDDNFYIVIHAEGNSFKAIVNGNDVTLSQRSLAKWIGEQGIDAKKQIVLLSCGDLTTAQHLSNKLGRSVVSNDGWVKVYENGVIEGENSFRKLTPNGNAVDAPIVKIGKAEATAGEDVVRLGNKATEGAADVTIITKKGQEIGKYVQGEYLELTNAEQVIYGGDKIILHPDVTTTVTGALDEVNVIANRGRALPGVTKMGANPGGINILRSPKWGEIKEKYKYMQEAGDELGYWKKVADEFWETANKPWLDEAIARRDAFRFVSDPGTERSLFVTDKLGEFILDANKNKIPSIFSRELEYLKAKGYQFLDDGTAVLK
jgi:hypothetical protein